MVGELIFLFVIKNLSHRLIIFLRLNKCTMCVQAKNFPKLRVFYIFSMLFACFNILLISGPRVRVPEGAPAKNTGGSLPVFFV